MKGAAGDEQDMVGLQRTVFGRDRRPFDQRKKVALHAFATNRTSADVADSDLVDLVQEDDAVRFGIGKRDAIDVVRIDALVRFLFGQPRESVRYLELAALARRLA